tara:strand:+ start:2623 stop:4977 length:2355 start_codon:yes stop_codon:yes gene_type:complete
MEDDVHIVDPDFLYDHKIGRKLQNSDQYQTIKIDIGSTDKQKKLLDGLEKLGFGDLRRMSPDDRFKGVILSLGQIQSGTWKHKQAINPTDKEGTKFLANILGGKFPMGLGSRDILKGYLDIAKYVGVAPEQDLTGTGITRPRAKTPLQKEFAEFEKGETMEIWQARTNNASYNSGLARGLKTAMGIFDMSPTDFLKGFYQHKIYKKDSDSFIWVYDEEGGKAETQTEWVKWVEKLVGYDKNKNFKTWMDSQGKEWNLIEFANDLDPDVYSGNNDMTHKGDKIRDDVSAQFKGGKGREKRLKEAIKHFLVAHGKIPAGKYLDTSWFYIGAPELKYGSLHMKDKEIIGMGECLKKPELEFTETLGIVHESAEKFLRDKRRAKNGKYWGEKTRVNLAGKTVPNPRYAQQQQALATARSREGKQVERKWSTELEDWKDAQDYFLYAVDIGWRANEAFSCGTSSQKSFIDGLKKSAIYQFGESDDVMIVKFLTRKTWGISERQGKSRYTVGVTVFDKKVMARLRERQAQVDAGLEYASEHPEVSQTELIKKYGIVTKFTNHLGNEETNTVHALIGYDGKYIGLGTMELQTTDDMTTAEKQDLADRKQKPEFMKQISKHQNKMRAIMRNCYERVFPKKHNLETYWTSNSLHSLRHVFAQAWLDRSDKDFQWVANRGHWGGIAILEQAYGQPKKEEQLRKDIAYSKISLEMAEQRIKDTEDKKDVAKDTNLNKEELEQLLAVVQKGLDTKFEVDKNYKLANPELSEGAEVGMEKASDKKEVEAKTEGVEPA